MMKLLKMSYVDKNGHPRISYNRDREHLAPHSPNAVQTGTGMIRERALAMRLGHKMAAGLLYGSPFWQKRGLLGEGGKEKPLA